MIQTFSSTIRRKEMDAVLTCMVDEKIGPGELNVRLVTTVKEFFNCDGAIALRSPAIALSYAFRALGIESGSLIMISALAPSWQYLTVKQSGYIPLVLDVNDETCLLSEEMIKQGIKTGGRLLILDETLGIMPDMNSIMALGVPVIEVISHSIGAFYSEQVTVDSQLAPDPVKRAGQAGSFGMYSILGMEEHDTITAGGGAILFAPGRREWIVLKKETDCAPRTDILPDINCALALVQLKEFLRNEESRKKIFALYQHSLMGSKHKTFARGADNASTIWSFPVVLSSGVKEVKQYAARKEIEIQSAFDDSVLQFAGEELVSNCIHAKSLLLRCVLFPLYPRLGTAEVTKIVKVLGTLP